MILSFETKLPLSAFARKFAIVSVRKGKDSAQACASIRHLGLPWNKARLPVRQ